MCYTTDPDVRWEFCEPLSNAVEEKAEESGAATYVGCFEDKSQRTLPTNLNLGKGQSLENCAAAAKAKGLRYAGL